MKKKIKIIDILCYISTGDYDKLPKEFEYADYHWNWCYSCKIYETEDDNKRFNLYEYFTTEGDLNDEVEILDNIPSPDNYVPIEKQTKVTPYEPYRFFVEDKDNFTGWKMYQDGKEVCSMDCSRDEEDEFEDIEEWGVLAFEEVKTKTDYTIKDLQRYIKLLMETQNELTRNQKKIINKLKEEGK